MGTTQTYTENEPVPEWKAVADEIWAMMRENAREFDRQMKKADEAQEKVRKAQEEDRKAWEKLRKAQEEDRKVREEEKKAREEEKKVWEEERKAREEERKVREEEEKRVREEDRKVREEEKKAREEEKKAREEERKVREEERKAFEKQMSETGKRVGEISNRFGEIVEYMVVPNLTSKFCELGFEFTRASKDHVIKDSEHDIILEVDAFLENGDKVMVVEIKNKPKESDIHHHIKRMEKLRKYADLHGDKRQYLGAVAGVVFKDNLKLYTLKHGFYVVEPSGETFRITEPTGKYHPHIW